MSYRLIYNEVVPPRAAATRTEYYPTEDRALGRARELIESGEHHGVAMSDHSGKELSGVRLQWRLGGYSGE